MSLINNARQAFAIHLVRPYIRHELPGWGRIFDIFVGGYRKDYRWKGIPPRWMRGKLHNYEMLLDLSKWSPRKTFFLGRFYDLGTQSVVRSLLRKGDTFVDIGANEGMISLLAASLVGALGKVVSFEPNPTPRSKLEAAILRNAIGTIDLRAVGLASEETELVLSVPKVNNGEGSFGRPDYTDDQIDAVICPVKIGDNELKGLKPRLLKIDVEGFETQVLKGLTEILTEARPFIVTEVVGRHLENAGSSVAELEGMLTAKGYKPLAMTLVRAGIGYRLKLKPATLRPNYLGDVLWVHADNAQEPAIAANLA